MFLATRVANSNHRVASLDRKTMITSYRSFAMLCTANRGRSLLVLKRICKLPVPFLNLCSNFFCLVSALKTFSPVFWRLTIQKPSFYYLRSFEMASGIITHKFKNIKPKVPAQKMSRMVWQNNQVTLMKMGRDNFRQSGGKEKKLVMERTDVEETCYLYKCKVLLEYMWEKKYIETKTNTENKILERMGQTD